MKAIKFWKYTLLLFILCISVHLCAQKMTIAQAKAVIAEVVKTSRTAMPSNNHSPRIWYDVTYSNNTMLMKFSLSEKDYLKITEPFLNYTASNMLTSNDYLYILSKHDDIAFLLEFAQAYPKVYQAFKNSGIVFESRIYDSSRQHLRTSFKFNFKDLQNMEAMKKTGLSTNDIVKIYAHEIGFIKGFSFASERVPYKINDDEYIYKQVITNKTLIYNIAETSHQFNVIKLMSTNEIKRKILGQCFELLFDSQNTFDLFKHLGYRIKCTYKDVDNSKGKELTITILDTEIADYVIKEKYYDFNKLNK